MARAVIFGEKPVPVPLFSATNPTWAGLGMNLGPHGKRLATSHMSHDMA